MKTAQNVPRIGLARAKGSHLEAANESRLIVPYTTSTGVQIGSTYIPRLSAVEARAGTRHVAPRAPVGRWLGWCAFAVFALVVIAKGVK
jgi:hypothetical protein